MAPALNPSCARIAVAMSLGLLPLECIFIISLACLSKKVFVFEPNTLCFLFYWNVLDHHIHHQVPFSFFWFWKLTLFVRFRVGILNSPIHQNVPSEIWKIYQLFL